MESNKPLVGVNYFAGWWRETPNKWQSDIRSAQGEHSMRCADLRGRYPERVPMYGCFTDQETMDWDIINASGHGVDYFQILWYPAACGIRTGETHAERLNDGMRKFMHSKENGRMKFTIEYCNHPPFDLESQQIWDETTEIWCEAFSHPSYLKIDGKILFKIHGHDFFVRQCGNLLGAARRLDDLRSKVKAKTGLDMIVTTGITSGDVPERVKDEMHGIDFFSTYMDIPDDEPSGTDYPYEKLFEFAAQMAERFGNASVPYQPYFPAGWNARPIYDPRPNYLLPNKAQVTDSVKKLMKIIDGFGCLGISEKGKGRIAKSFTVYAWNECSEGGMLAPSIVDGFDRLEGLRDAVCE